VKIFFYIIYFVAASTTVNLYTLQHRVRSGITIFPMFSTVFDYVGMFKVFFWRVSVTGKW